MGKRVKLICGHYGKETPGSKFAWCITCQRMKVVQDDDSVPGVQVLSNKPHQRQPGCDGSMPGQEEIKPR